MSSHRTLTFVTGNVNKTREIGQILQEDGLGHDWTVTNLALDLPELQGDPDEVSRAKCELAVKEVKGPVLVEDTSLCFNALGGLPGVYIKWFLDKMQLNDISIMLNGFDDKTAYAQCIFSYCEGPNQRVYTFVGQTNGVIVPPRGTNGFGWDPIFECRDEQLNGTDDFAKTYAEMSVKGKNLVSHRFRAIRAVTEFLKNIKDC